MIGLPTTVSSRMSSRSTPASFASSAVSFARQPRTARVSSFSEPGCIITYETRLIRSSPKRICGFIAPAEASTSPREDVAQVARDRRRADVERDPVGGLVEAGPDRGEVGAVVDGDGDAPVAGAERPLQARGARGRRPRGRSAATRARAPRGGGRGRSSARRGRAPRPRRSGAGRRGRPRSGARRPPCGRPAGAPGSRAGRRSRARPRRRRCSRAGGPSASPRSAA